MIKSIRPMLATLVGRPFNRPGWINEEKYDGFRALAYRGGKKVRLYSRNLKEITVDFPEIVEALSELSGDGFMLDGEIVAFDRKGISHFQLLQRRELVRQTSYPFHRSAEVENCSAITRRKKRLICSLTL